MAQCEYTKGERGIRIDRNRCYQNNNKDYKHTSQNFPGQDRDQCLLTVVRNQF